MKYVFPILFPLDLVVMLALAGAMGAASSHWLAQIYPSAAWLGLVVPAVYLLSDLIEDCLLAWLLLRGDPKARGTVGLDPEGDHDDQAGQHLRSRSR